MPEDKDKLIADLKECLAGFMLTAGMNGQYLEPAMIQWCQTHLKGKQRTPVQVWREIVATEKD